MEKKPGFRKKLDSFFAGKGFYIVLFLCVAVIGVSAWIMFGGNGATVDESGAGGLTAAQATALPTVPAYSGDDMGSSDSDTVLAPEESSDVPADAAPATETPAAEAPAAATDAPAPETPAVAPAVAEPAFVWPVVGGTERPYSVDKLLYDPTMADWRTHSGVDIDAGLGDQVVAAGTGTVERVYSDDLLGTTVVIDHGGGLKSFYANLAATPTVVEGDSVTAGTIIGSVGDTAIGETGEATHLHFAMTQDDKPVDPADYLP